MAVVFNPALDIVKFQCAFANNLQKLSRRHIFELTLSKCNRQGAHFALHIQLFNTQNNSLESDDFVAVNCPLYKVMDSCQFDAVDKVGLS